MDENIAKADAVRDALVTYFSGACRLHVYDQGPSPILALDTPLARFDDCNVTIFIKCADDGWLLHDGGRTVNYLADHGIDLFSSSQKQLIFRKYLHDLLSKHKMSVPANSRRLVMQLTEVDGRNVLAFIECLVALSFLVLVRQAGLAPLTKRSIENLANLKVKLQGELPGVHIRTGIRPSAGNLPINHRWGISLYRPDDKQPLAACLQYLDGENWDKISRNVLITAALYQKCKQWLHIPPQNFITVYAGPNELADNARKMLDQFRNGTRPRMVMLEDTTAVVRAVKAVRELKAAATSQKRHRWARQQLPQSSSVVQPLDFLVADSEPPVTAAEPSLEDIWESNADVYNKELTAQEQIAEDAERWRVLFADPIHSQIVKAISDRGAMSSEEIRRFVNATDLPIVLRELVGKALLVERHGTFSTSEFAKRALASPWAGAPEYFAS